MQAINPGIQRIARFLPQGLRTALREFVNLQEYDLARRRANNPFLDFPREDYPGSPFRFGIIEDPAQYHKYYIAACRELGFSYEVLSLLRSDWMGGFLDQGFDAFLVWPGSVSTTVKETFDYRLHILERDLGLMIYPTWKECWLSEHKPRLRDWMEAHSIPHPRTWVFHDRESALDFCAGANLPMVVKTATGASASGITVARSSRELVHAVRTAFGRGLRPRGFEPRDRQRGFVFLQEYLPGVEEWRMVRIGDSYFGYRKERGPSGLHSASHTWSWLDPGPELLDLLKHVTDVGGFTSMDVDIFRTPEGALLVNECQTVFGCSTPAVQMKIDDVEGRYVWEEGRWRFEPGSYCANHMCNLRIHYLCTVLENRSLSPAIGKSSPANSAGQ